MSFVAQGRTRVCLFFLHQQCSGGRGFYWTGSKCLQGKSWRSDMNGVDVFSDTPQIRNQVWTWNEESIYFYVPHSVVIVFRSLKSKKQ